MPLQLFTSLVKSSTPVEIVRGGSFKSESLGFALSAAHRALGSRSSSRAPKTPESSSMVSSRPSLGAALRRGKPISTRKGSGATPLGESSRSKHSSSFGSFKGVGSLDTQLRSHFE